MERSRGRNPIGEYAAYPRPNAGVFLPNNMADQNMNEVQT